MPNEVHKTCLIVIGDAFIDIAVPVHHINAGETYYRDIRVDCGGMATVAVQAAEMGIDTQFVGRVGKDALGSFFIEHLRRHSVKDMIAVDERRPTGVCVSLVFEDGERVLIANRGANDCLTMNDIESCFREIVQSDIVYLSGYNLTHNTDVVLDIAQRLKDVCGIWFNPGAPNLVTEELKDFVREYVDVLILNLDEAIALTGAKQIEKIASGLTELVATVVITTGVDGCTVAAKGMCIAVPQTASMLGINSTGAGDVFSAGFIQGWLQDFDLVECARLGNVKAAKYLARKGAQ